MATAFRIRTGILLMILGLVVNPWVVAAVAADDGSIRSPLFASALLFVAAAIGLAGAQLIWRWADLVSWVKPAGGVRASLIVAIASGLIAGTHWRVATYAEAHTHMTLVDTGHTHATAEQQRWADDFHRRALAAAIRNGWFDIDTAFEQGFQPDRVNRTHYPNLQYMFDDVILDPERPEWLIYNDHPDGGKVLMGFMFFTRELMDVGPTPAGPLAQWHYHPYDSPRCAVEGIWTVARVDENGACAEGIPVTRTPEMFHVWFIDHPLGRFTEMNVVSEYWQEPGVDVHPMVVHFAIALFVIAVFFDLAAVVTRRPRLHWAAWVNLVVAAIAAIAAAATGVTAELLLKPTHEAHQTLDMHKLLGFSSLGAILLLFVWRYALRGQFPRRGMIGYLAVSLVSLGALAGAGYYGGRMVFQHGAGVSAIEQFARDRYLRQVRDVYRPETVQDGHVAPAGHASH